MLGIDHVSSHRGGDTSSLKSRLLIDVMNGQELKVPRETSLQKQHKADVHEKRTLGGERAQNTYQHPQRPPAGRRSPLAGSYKTLLYHHHRSSPTTKSGHVGNPKYQSPGPPLPLPQPAQGQG